MHEKGFNIILHYNNSALEAENISKELNKMRENSCFAIRANFNSETSINSLVEQVKSITETLDLLVNNASSFYPTPIDTASSDQWKDLTDTNVTTPLFLIQALTLYLKRANGCVINISDTLVKNGIKEYSLYSGAKAALEGITKSLAKELAPTVRVNGIAPGPTIKNSRQSEKHFKKQYMATPLKRQVDVEQICNAVDFFIKNRSITGQVISIDSGQSLNWQTPDIMGGKE